MKPLVFNDKKRMKPTFPLLVAGLLHMTLQGCNPSAEKITTDMNQTENTVTDTATFGAGCFWCTEAIFLQLKGVLRVESGYSGGARPNPTYEQISSGATGHAEVTQIVFNPEVISFKDLLEVFWKTHDPTTLNRQGADVGTQYRSVIFYHNDTQKEMAEFYKKELDSSGSWKDPIVTEISALKAFYKAEDYHQNYYNNNKRAPYCTFVIGPKLEKFEKVFGKRFSK